MEAIDITLIASTSRPRLWKSDCLHVGQLAAVGEVPGEPRAHPVEQRRRECYPAVCYRQKELDLLSYASGSPILGDSLQPGRVGEAA